MFTIRAGSVEDALRKASIIPRGQRDKDDFVIDVFKLDDREEFFISKVNDMDNFQTGQITENDQETIDRRIQRNWQQLEPALVKTADMYDEEYVLERCYAPRWVANQLMVPNRVSKQEVLHEFFRQATIKYGLKKGVPFFAMLYYMQYGKGNDLKIHCKDGRLWYYNRNKVNSFDLTENQMRIMNRFGVNEEAEARIDFNAINSISTKDSSRPSRIDKFNAKWGTPKQPGEE